MQGADDSEQILSAAGSAISENDFSGPILYRREDYVGPFRHLLIFAVDSCVLYFLLVALTLIAIPIGDLITTNPMPIVALLWLILSWVYLAVMKPSRFRSVGYWIADARIITIYGKPPSPGQMTMRLIWAAMYWVPYFTVSIFTDLIWTTMNDERQMLRDLIVGTRMIRHHAKPVGVGKVSRCLLTGLGITVFYAIIRPRTITSDVRKPEGTT